MARTKKRPSGAAQIKAQGKTAVLVALNAEQIDLLDRAANAEGRKRPNFLSFHGLAAAEKILEKLSRNP